MKAVRMRRVRGGEWFGVGTANEPCNMCEWDWKETQRWKKLLIFLASRLAL
jgi:hypothetical protein